jgi:hypothetical protein
MDFKLVSKNNMGIVITLILAILLSQARFFDFLIDTHLGRMVLLAFVILIAYTNKILGLVAVLFVIITFNNKMNTVHSYNFYEGFDVSGNNIPTDGTAKDKIKDKIQSNVQNNMNSNTNSSTTTATSSAVSGTETFKGREGFNMADRELNMLRGKPSNSVPVFNNLRNQSDDVSPSDKTVFSSEYASF